MLRTNLPLLSGPIKRYNISQQLFLPFTYKLSRYHRRKHDQVPLNNQPLRCSRTLKMRSLRKFLFHISFYISFFPISTFSYITHLGLHLKKLRNPEFVHVLKIRMYICIFLLVLFLQFYSSGASKSKPAFIGIFHTFHTKRKAN